MKKALQILIFLIFSIKSFAQLDREHWFAPMYDGQSNHSGYEQFLHLSTNEITPFTVSIYNNNTLIEQRTISKGSPAVVEIPRNYIITDDDSYELNMVITKGLYVKGDRPLFANLRFGVTNHSEIITSKGTAGIGTDFYTVMAPNALNGYGFGASASVLATEDNTTVTIGGFKKNIDFNTYGFATEFTFKLNKGEAYILDVRSTNPNNWDGFIGAKVTSDKPISMSNGNFNGQYASSTAIGSDILMDQSVPVNKLGDEFVIVKGYGKIGNNMEGAIIVATQKNTSIYLNDDVIPVKVLANEGDYYRVEETKYVDRGNGHYNLHIKTDKNAYVYQLLGGVEGGDSPLATGGMNYIPPLNCYLPRKIDEISYINKIQETDDEDRFVTKLNIITEKGATVKVNGVIPSSAYGPYDISNIAANQQWVSYSIPGVKGNVTVVSDKAVTAGIASGNGAFGYGGYFAGFSSIPLILKTEGECLPGVKLEVTEGFDFYQWEIKNELGIFVNAPVTTEHPSNKMFYYYPQKAGVYRVRIQQGSCLEIKTDEFKFYNCTTYTNVNYETCTEISDITPEFSLSSQTPGIPTISEQAKKGLAEVLPNGHIKYTANSGESGVDTFKFSFCGKDVLPDCEITQATIQINQIVGKDDILTECTSTGIAEYDLRKANVTSDSSVKKVYYKTPSGAQFEIDSDEIKNFTEYSSANATVYVRIKNSKNCTAIQKIALKTIFFPVINTSITVEECDDDFDSQKLIQNLDNYKVLFTNDSSVSAKFYVKRSDAQDLASINNINEINVNRQQLLYVRLYNAAGCSSVAEFTIKIKLPKKSDRLADKTICPETKTYLDAGEGFTYKWYRESDPGTMIDDSQRIDDLGVGKYFVILTSPNGCPYRQSVEIKAAELPEIESIEINGNTVKINAKGGVKPYKYAIDNGSYQDSNIFTDVSPGLHKAYVISADDCDPVEKEFSVIKIYNLVTPNNDGVNDVLDMSNLDFKKNVKFQIFDREGKKLFEGNATNHYIWDGKQNGKSLPSSSYWYIMEWQDFENSPPVKYTGWVLLKNRT